MKSLAELVCEDLALEQRSAIVLYTGFGGGGYGGSSFGGGGSPFLFGYDMPSMRAQLHFHGDDMNHLTYGKLKSYDGLTLKEFKSSFELAMLDFSAMSIGLKKFP